MIRRTVLLWVLVELLAAVLAPLPAPAWAGAGSIPADWTAESDQPGAAFGASAAAAGDVNGDGYADLLVGAPYYDQTWVDAGRVFLFSGSAAGLSATAGWTAAGDQAGARFGFSVSAAGDVNGDGYTDLLVGAPEASHGQPEEGAVSAFYCAAAGPPAQASWAVEGDQANAAFGFSVSAAGDVNGDGYDDVIVGAKNGDHGEIDEGFAYVYAGSSTGLEHTPAWMAEGGQSGAAFGFSVAGAGDVNGDGFDDVLVGAPGYDASQTSGGRVFLYLGSPAGLSQSPQWTAGGGDFSMTRIRFGVPVNGIGDVNGDGYEDVIVGASVPVVSAHLLREAYVYYGSPSGPRAAPGWSIFSSIPDELVAAAAGTAGDVDGDGLSDLIVGAPVSLKSYFERAYLYLGAPTGLGRTANWIAESAQTASAFGTAAGTAGDVDGDGYADILVGAPEYSNGQAGEGQVAVYTGRSLRAVLRPNFFAYLPVVGK